ncbi:MAG: MerR family transcriptional regulator [Myxococcota bacterium]
MSRAVRSAAEEPSYSMRDVVRATGLSEHALRAWERRHRAIEPQRSPGGTRRYSSEDLARILLLKRLVDGGARIGELAALPHDALLERAAARERRAAPDDPPWAPALEALSRFDAEAAQRLLAHELAARGAVGFATHVALPLLAELGERWHRGEAGPATEHLATALARHLLGDAVRARARGPETTTVVCATPQGERHELGLVAGAIVADAAGARVVFLGADLPPGEIARAARAARADVVLLALTALPEAASAPQLATLRAALPARTELWLGGPAAAAPRGPGVRILRDFEELDRHVRMRVRAGPAADGGAATSMV